MLDAAHPLGLDEDRVLERTERRGSVARFPARPHADPARARTGPPRRRRSRTPAARPRRAADRGPGSRLAARHPSRCVAGARPCRAGPERGGSATGWGWQTLSCEFLSMRCDEVRRLRPTRARRCGIDDGHRAAPRSPRRRRRRVRRPTNSAWCRPATYAVAAPCPSAAPAGTIAPKTATPTAIPPWRKASLTPASRPLSSIGPAPRATIAERRVEQPGSDADDEIAGQDHRPGGVRADERDQQQSGGDEDEPGGHEGPRGKPLAELGARGRDDEQQHGPRQVDESGVERGQVQHVLQVQRHVQEQREERRRDRECRHLRRGEVPPAEHAEGQHRSAHARLNERRSSPAARPHHRVQRPSGPSPTRRRWRAAGRARAGTGRR